MPAGFTPSLFSGSRIIFIFSRIISMCSFKIGHVMYPVAIRAASISPHLPEEPPPAGALPMSSSFHST
jgi:hypothetical protein